LRNEPFGEDVEGLSYCQQKICIVDPEVQLTTLQVRGNRRLRTQVIFQKSVESDQTRLR